MYICSIANQKGGVGKTTTAHNLAMALVDMGKRVLLVDLDPQRNLTAAMGVGDNDDVTAFSILDGSATMPEATIALSDTLHFIPASKKLYDADVAFATKVGRENLLRKSFTKANSNAAISYDYVLMDCPPNLGLVTVNAFCASHGVLIPVQCEYFGLLGIDQILETMDVVKENLNVHLSVLGIVFTFYDSRKKLNKDVVARIDDDGYGFRFSTKIRDAVALAAAPSSRKSIFQHDGKSYGAQDYKNLALEFVDRVKAVEA